MPLSDGYSMSNPDHLVKIKNPNCYSCVKTADFPTETPSATSWRLDFLLLSNIRHHIDLAIFYAGFNPMN